MNVTSFIDLDLPRGRLCYNYVPEETGHSECMAAVVTKYLLYKQHRTVTYYKRNLTTNPIFDVFVPGY